MAGADSLRNELAESEDSLVGCAAAVAVGTKSFYLDTVVAGSNHPEHVETSAEAHSRELDAH